MRTTTARIASIATLAAFALAGCGSAAEETPAAEQPSQSDSGGAAGNADEETASADPADIVGDIIDDDGSFSITDEPLSAHPATGGTYSIIMDATTEDHEEVAWLEQYREDVGGEPVSYVVADIDNRDGTESLELSSIYVYDVDGNEYECESPEWYVDENWRPVWLYGSTDEDAYTTADGEPMDYDTAEELEKRAGEFEYASGASELQKSTDVALCPDLLPERATGVEVWPLGIVGEPLWALPESLDDLDGMDG